MLKRIPVYLVFIGIACGLNYYSTSNLKFTILLALIGLLMFILLIEPYLRNFEIKEKRTKECVSFINNFLITLSINQSIRLTFESMKESFSKDLLQQVKLNEHLDVESQIRQLKFYFNSDIFNVFLNLLDQYIYNGGDILKISQLLMFDARKVGESLDNHISLLVRKIVEFISLWAMTFLILIIMKIALNKFYFQIASGMQFQAMIFIFFIVFYVNILFFILHGFSLKFIKSSTSNQNQKQPKLKAIKAKKHKEKKERRKK